MKAVRGPLAKPTEVELELLVQLWRRGAATVREIHDAVRGTRPVGYTSVLKTLQIMTDKGLVHRSAVGKAHVYRASVSQEVTQDQLLRDVRDRLFAGSAADLAMHALGLDAVEGDELEAIRVLIESRRSCS